MEEFQIKRQKVISLLEEKGLEGILLSKRESFSWITCGANNFVAKFTDMGVVELIITKTKCYAIASEIERYRTMDEEIKNLDFELVHYNWYENKEKIIRSLINGEVIGSDSGLYGTVNIYESFRRLRFSLIAEEIVRLRELSRATADAMYKVCNEIKIGDSEFDMAAMIGSKLMKQGIQLPVCLMAADERIKKYRHPIPTENKVKKYALVVVGTEKYGLNVSMSRMISFGAPDEEILKRQKACLSVDSVLNVNTVVGAVTADIFKKAQEQYKNSGYPNEWKFHHQGGAAGYKAREYVVNNASKEIVMENQIFAWNPTISGTKCEDTIITTKDGQEFLTTIKDWPTQSFYVNGVEILRPDILVR